VRGNPLVSVIVPTRGSRGTVWGRERSYVTDALHSVEQQSTYRNLEYVVVADTDTPAAAVDALRSVPGLTVVPYDGPFNFSDKVNRGVVASRGEYVLLLNDDTELIEPDSIRVMVALAQDTDARYGDVGMVGAKLLFSDGTLQHGGHVYHGEMMHALIHWPGEHPGPGRVLAVERECSGVTAAAALLPRRVYDEVGGLPVDLPVHFNDVELSMKVRAAGYRILWTPYACWYHFESRSRTDRATMDEWNRIDRRWHDRLHHDPYYNVNLAPKRADWLELPGRSGAPPYDDRR
jgi:GT2 family glycosyltransferase